MQTKSTSHVFTETWTLAVKLNTFKDTIVSIIETLMPRLK